MEAMSYAVGPGDLVLCVNAAPNHVTGEQVPLVVGETYTVGAVVEFACPCGRSDALLDVGVDFVVPDALSAFAEAEVQSRTRRASRLRAAREGDGALMAQARTSALRRT
jgi:hypothetical protein